MISRVGQMAALVFSLQKDGVPLREAVEQFEETYIDAALHSSSGNVTEASKKLGVHRNTIHAKLRTIAERGRAR